MYDLSAYFQKAYRTLRERLRDQLFLLIQKQMRAETAASVLALLATGVVMA
jgi:hypothetical protein